MAVEDTFEVGEEVKVVTPVKNNEVRVRQAVVIGVQPGKSPDCITVRYVGHKPSSKARVHKNFCTTMRTAILIVLAALAPTLHAQTVSPVVSEYGKKASGSFTVTNNALTPVSVVVESQSFTVGADGKASYRPLDSGVEVRLSESSSRLGPKQSHEFDYDIKCASLPCTVTFWSVVTGLHTDSGIAMAVHLPAVVYICGKANNCRKETRKTWGVVE